MKITVSGSLGNISKPLVEALINQQHEVTVITSNPDRQQAIEALGAKAAVGSVGDAGFLAGAFDGADAIYAMTPPNLGGSNVVANTQAAGQAYAAAFREAGVKRIVMLSSIGADRPDGTGPIKGIHQVEEIYRELTDANITFLRAGFFYYNFFNDIPLIRNAGILGANYPATLKIPMVHPQDIAKAVAMELQSNQSGNEIKYVVSDIRTSAEVAAVLGAAIGQPELPWVEFSDAQYLEGMVNAGLPAEIAGLYAEMGTGLRTGLIGEHFAAFGSPVSGQIRLEEFASEFKEKFLQ